MHEILIFGNSAFYLNIMLEVHQVPFGHHLGPRVNHIGGEIVKIRNLGFLLRIHKFFEIHKF